MIRVFTSPTQALGEKGEDAAVAWLKQEGFKILERNVAGKYGEIDIVANKKRVVYFFEVKAGKSGGIFNPAENLTQAKIRKFLISAEHYALTHEIRDYRVQGIIVLMDTEGTSKIETIDLV